MLILILACGGSEIDTGTVVDPLSWPVDSDGPMSVGHRAWSLTYTPDIIGGERTINLNLWYPTEDEDGEEVRYINLYLDNESLGEATPAEPVHEEGYPVMVYSHGSQGFGGTSADLMRHFASHGWVVIAPDHTDNLLSDHNDPLPTSHYIHRPMDVTKALDALAETTLAGPIVTDRVVASGHSFGCYSNWASMGATYDITVVAENCANGGVPSGVCTEEELEAFASGSLKDERIVSAIPMAGTYRSSWFGETGYQSVGGPLLFMSGTDDPVGQDDQWDALVGIDLTWIDITDACHQTFGLGVCPNLTDEEGFSIVNTYALAFARSTLLNDDSVRPILDGTEIVSERVAIETRSAD